jgi:hypothetical protein
MITHSRFSEGKVPIKVDGHTYELEIRSQEDALSVAMYDEFEEAKTLLAIACGSIRTPDAKGVSQALAYALHRCYLRVLAEEEEAKEEKEEK